MFRDGHTPSLKDIKFSAARTLAVVSLLTAPAFLNPDPVDAVGPCEVGAGVRAIDSEGYPAVGQQITITSPFSKDSGILITGKDGVGLSQSNRDKFGNPEKYVSLKGESNTVVNNKPNMTVLVQAEEEGPKQFNLDCDWNSIAQPVEIKTLTPAHSIPEAATSGRDINGKDVKIILTALHKIPVLREIGDLSDATGSWVNKQITDLHNSDKSWSGFGDFFRDLGLRIHEHPVAAYIGDNLNFLILPVLLILRNRLYRRRH